MAPSSRLTAAGLRVMRGIGESRGVRFQVPGEVPVGYLQTMRTSTEESVVVQPARNPFNMAAECSFAT